MPGNLASRLPNMWKPSENGTSKLSKPRGGSSSLRFSDTKRRPSILRKEGAESRTDSDVGDGAGGRSEPRRKFSLKDAARRIFSGKQDKDRSKILQVSINWIQKTPVTKPRNLLC